MSIFINYSFHSSKFWCKNQIDEAKSYGDIVDLIPEEIEENMTSDEIDNVCIKALNEIMKYDNPTVMVQANYVSSFRLVKLLKEHNIKALAAYSIRGEIDYPGEDNNVTMTEKKFVFLKFIEY